MTFLANPACLSRNFQVGFAFRFDAMMFSSFVRFCFDVLASSLWAMCPVNAEWRLEGCLKQLSNILGGGDYGYRSIADSRRRLARQFRRFLLGCLLLVLFAGVIFAVVMLWSEAISAAVLMFDHLLPALREAVPALAAGAVTLPALVQGDLYEPSERVSFAVYDGSWESRLAQLREECRVRAEEAAAEWLAENPDMWQSLDTAQVMAAGAADEFVANAVQDGAQYDGADELYEDVRLHVQETLDDDFLNRCWELAAS